MRKTLLGSSLMIAVVMMMMVSAATAVAGPVWRIDSLSNTTVQPGGTLQYLVETKNVGDADMDGSEIDLTGTLPRGLTAVDGTLLLDGGDTLETNVITCTAGDGSPIAGASDIRCANTTPVPAMSFGGFQLLRLTTRADNSVRGTLESSFAVSGGGASGAQTVDPVRVADVLPPFGVDAFDGAVLNADGSASTQAGGHPASATVSIDFNTLTNPLPLKGTVWPVEPTKDVLVDLPPGLVGDPTSLDQCTALQLAGVNGNPLPDCPPTAQVGTVMVRTNSRPFQPIAVGPLPVYNVVPPPNVPARFGFNFLGTVVVLDASLRSGGDYGITVNTTNISEAIPVAGSTFTFWGVPSDPSHDVERACPNRDAPALGGPTCPSGAPPTAFLRNPTSCGDPDVGLPTTVHIDSWFNPGVFRSATFFSHLAPGYPEPSADQGRQVGITGCDSVPFRPTLDGQPQTGKANSPSGFAFDLTLPQSNDPTSPGESDLRTAVVTLPEGVRVNPSSAGGLASCSPSEIGLVSAVGGSSGSGGANPIRFTEDAPACPDGSKIGDVKIVTPLLDDPVEGSVYLAGQGSNPFGSLLALYLYAKAPGVSLKLAGHVESDPVTGQLVTVFDNQPQLPFSKLTLTLNGGFRAPLVAPRACGVYKTHAQLTGWNGKVVATNSNFTIGEGADGAPCNTAQFKPSLTAGTTASDAGGFTPFALRLQRSDSDQEFRSLGALSLPPGLSASLRGTTYCPDSVLDAADTSKNPGLTGAQELAAPSCPVSSRIGTATVGAGAGPDPFYVNSGKIYLAGPYRGAPLSVAVSVPAVAGPFDLGNVITRAALYIDPSDASLRAVSDPFPTILDGIPLQIKDIRLNVARPHFMLNPTNCSQMSVDGTVLSTENMSADVHSRFQVGECAALGFKPKLSFRLKGGTKRGDHPKFQATLKARPGDANIDRVSVALPHSEFLDQAHIGTVCTRPQFAAGKCPPASVYGYARAITPLLDKPLEGPVYLRSSSNKLPDLVADLNGQIHIVLDGRIDSVNGGIRNTFDVIPDAPVSKFTLNMQGGKKGLLVNSTNLCKKDSFAVAKVRGQNGAYANQNPQMKNDCGAKHGKKKH